MPLALFDLDNTLLSNDSDYLWGQFLADEGLVDREYYESENKRFYKEYQAGTLDIYEFCRFSFKPLADNSIESLLTLRERFMQKDILPFIGDKARALINKHKQQGDELVIITATNRFVTEPIAKELGIEHLLATEPEYKDGQYTGELLGTPCFQEGKISNLNGWLKQHPYNLDDAYFYSDSNNDLPLLKAVGNPVVVDGDEKLSAYAKANNWPELSLAI